MEATNTGTSPIGLPGKKILMPGKSMLITASEAKAFKKNKVVAAWIKSGTLAIGDAIATDPADEPEVDQGDSSADTEDYSEE